MAGIFLQALKIKFHKKAQKSVSCNSAAKRTNFITITFPCLYFVGLLPGYNIVSFTKCDVIEYFTYNWLSLRSGFIRSTVSVIPGGLL